MSRVTARCLTRRSHDASTPTVRSSRHLACRCSRSVTSSPARSSTHSARRTTSSIASTSTTTSWQHCRRRCTTWRESSRTPNRSASRSRTSHSGGPGSPSPRRTRQSEFASAPRLLAGAGRPPGEARVGHLEAAHGSFRLLEPAPREAGRAHGQPVRAPPGRRQLVHRRPRPRPRHDADLQGFAYPRRHSLRDEARARLPDPRGLRRRAASRSAAVADR